MPEIEVQITHLSEHLQDALTQIHGTFANNVLELKKSMTDSLENGCKSNEQRFDLIDKNFVEVRRELHAAEQSIHHHLHNVKTIASISARLRNEKVKTCLFLVHNANAWDAIADIYKAMSEAPDFEPWVAAIDKNFPGENGYSGGEDVALFLDSINIPHFKWYGADSYMYLDIAKSLAPAFIFVQSPWDNDLPPAFRPQELQFSKLCYVPYFGMTLVDDFRFGEGRDLQYDQQLHRVAFAIFVESEHQRSIFSKRCAKRNIHVLNSGSAKISRLHKFRENTGVWPIRDGNFKRKLRLIWAPHHSVGNDWLNFGMFHVIYENMLQFAKKNTSWLEIVLKPHPALFANVVAAQLITDNRLKIWIKEWSELSNCEIVSDGNYGYLFSASDFMLTDGISFLIEYPIATGKPLVFLERKDHLKFNHLGELALEYASVVHDFAAFEMVTQKIKSGDLIVANSADEAIINECAIADAEPSEHIIQFLRNS